MAAKPSPPWRLFKDLVMEKLNAVIKKILSVEASDIHDGLSPGSTPAWDSMNHLLLISEIEKVFNIQFAVSEIMAIENLGDIKKHLQEKGITL